MLNHSTSLSMSTSVLKALPGNLDIKRQSYSILYLLLGGLCWVLVLYVGLSVSCSFTINYLADQKRVGLFIILIVFFLL